MHADPRTLRVAVVGSGPSGFYAAGHLLGRTEGPVEVDLYDRLPTPFGLVRGGVAPDHPKLKSVTIVYDKIAAEPGFRFFGNVAVGVDVSAAELMSWYDAVIYAVGASSHRDSGIPGEGLEGSVAATDFVGWYNGHPDFRDCVFDLSGDRAVVIGNGNVALDVARMLTRTPEELNQTDVADHALDALSRNVLREVVVLGRRGPEQASFSSQELRELGEMPGADVAIDPAECEIPAELREADDDKGRTRNMKILRDLAGSAPSGKPRRLLLRFLASPVEILGEDKVEAVRIAENELARDDSGALVARSTGREEVLAASLVIRAIGYHGREVHGIPFDEARGVIPNERGRVVGASGVVPGLYVVGWIKRGPSGLIGANRSCALETVEALMDDARAGRLSPDGSLTADQVGALVRRRVPSVVEYAEWQLLDHHERATGEPLGRPRVKITSVTEMLDVIAEQGGTP